MTKKIVGYISVDAGLCWIGDPCYVLPDDAEDNPGADWGEFCDKLEYEATSFKHKAGHEGVGVCISTGYGDGTYPVEVEYKDGRISKAIITFIEDD